VDEGQLLGPMISVTEPIQIIKAGRCGGPISPCSDGTSPLASCSSSTGSGSPCSREHYPRTFENIGWTSAFNLNVFLKFLMIFFKIG
jgi:hypothetical protein